MELARAAGGSGHSFGSYGEDATGRKTLAHWRAAGEYARVRLLIAGAALCGATVVGINPTRRGAGLAAYNAMPIFHGNALMSALGPCIANGAAFALRRRFSASGFRPDIRRFGATLVERILLRFPLRVTARLPETATHKISKPSLRRLLWHGEEPVYERLGSGYSLMTADRKDALEAEFARHGRDQFLRL